MNLTKLKQKETSFFHPLKTSIFLIISCLTGLNSFGQHQTEWANSIGGQSVEYPTSINTDLNSNLITTGVFWSDSLVLSSNNNFDTLIYTFDRPESYLIKYNSEGGKLWQKIFSAPKIRPDKGLNTVGKVYTALDIENNIYCAGYFSGAMILEDSLELKINEINGYNYSKGYILKYTPEGSLKWIKQINWENTNPDPKSTHINSIQIGKKGSIFISGGSINSHPNFGNDIILNPKDSIFSFVAKYNSAGEALWAISITSDSTFNINDMAIDEEENVCLVGYFRGKKITFDKDISVEVNGLNPSGFITKINSNGEVAWAKSILGEKTLIKAVTPLPKGYFSFGGIFQGKGITYNGQYGEFSIVDDKTSYDIFIFYIDGNGNEQRRIKFGSNNTDLLSDLNGDKKGNLYFSGSTYSEKLSFGNYQDVYGTTKFPTTFLTKISVSGDRELIFSLGKIKESLITSDTKGNSFITGRFFSEKLDFENDINLNLHLTNNANFVLGDNFVAKLFDSSKRIILKSFSFGNPTNLKPSFTPKPLLGFSLSPNGSTKLSSITIKANREINDDLFNFCLVTSNDQQYGTDGDNQVFKITPTISGDSIQFTNLDELITDHKNFFLIADISEKVDENTPSIQFSFSDEDISLTPGIIQNQEIVSDNFSFQSRLNLPSPDPIWAKSIWSHGSDFITQTTIDTENNYIVTGFHWSDSIHFSNSKFLTNNPNVGAAVFLAKYNAAGDVLWAKNTTGSGSQYPYDLITDDSGNIYVTGEFSSEALNFGNEVLVKNEDKQKRMFLVKYNSNGIPLWANTVNGVNTSEGRSLSLDAKGNVYLLGDFKTGNIDFGDGFSLDNSDPSGNTSDIFVAKYSTGGAIIWAKVLEGSANDEAAKIVSDAQNNIYITGSFLSPFIDIDQSEKLINTQGENLFLLKLDENGSSVWKKNIAKDSANIYSATISESGEIYLAGDFNAQLLDFGNSVTINSKNHSSITDAFLVKFDSQGIAVWAKTMASDGYESISSLSINDFGDIYLSGHFEGKSLNLGNSFELEGKGDYDIFMANYSTNGQLNWAKGIGGIAWEAQSYISVDQNNEIYLTGYFESESISFEDSLKVYNQFTGDLFLAKFGQPNSNIILQELSKGIAQNLIHADNQKNAAVLGFSLKAKTISELSQIKFFTNRNINGDITQFKLVKSADDNFLTTDDNLVVSTNPEVNSQTVIFSNLNEMLSSNHYYFLVVDVTPNLDPRTPFIQFHLTQNDLTVTEEEVKENKIISKIFPLIDQSDFNPEWARSAKGNHYDTGKRVITDALGNVYVAGKFSSDILTFSPHHVVVNALTGNEFPTTDVYLAKYNKEGAIQWVRSAKGSETEDVYDLKINNEGNIEIEGLFFSKYLDFGVSKTISRKYDFNRNYFKAIYNSQGEVLFADNVESIRQTGEFSTINDKLGNRYKLSEFSEDSIVFENVLKLYNPHEIYDYNSIYIVKYDSLKNPIWATAIGGPLVRNYCPITLDNAGNIYCAGEFASGTIYFNDSIQITNLSAMPNIFLSKFNPEGEIIWAKSFESNHEEYCRHIITDSQDNIWLTGDFLSNELKFSDNSILYNDKNYDIFLAKFDSDGNVLAAKGYGDDHETRAVGLYIDSKDNLYMTGAFESATLDFGDTITLHATGEEWVDVFTVKYSPGIYNNNPPEVVSPINSLPFQTGFGKASINISNVFLDSDGDSLNYSFHNSDTLVTKLSFQGDSLIVLEQQPGVTTITLRADDGFGGKTETNFTITINKSLNSPPYVIKEIEDHELDKGFEIFSFNLNEIFKDDDGDSLSFSAASSQADVATTDIFENNLSIIENAPGETFISVTANDLKGGTVSTEFKTTITAILGLEDSELSRGIDVFPNPVGKSLKVSSKFFTGKKVYFYCFNSTGTKINLIKENKTKKQFSFNFKDIPAGVYLLIINVEGKLAMKRFVKSN